MSELAARKLHGTVRTLRIETAEWDESRGAWQIPRGITIVTFDRDGQSTETEHHNPDGSVAKWTRPVDEHDGARRIKEETLPVSDVPIHHNIEGGDQYYSAPGATTKVTTYDDRGLPATMSL